MNEKPYFTPFLPYPYQIRCALRDLKYRVWNRPYFGDWPAPTVMDMKKLKFYKWMYKTGRITDE